MWSWQTLLVGYSSFADCLGDNDFCCWRWWQSLKLLHLSNTAPHHSFLFQNSSRWWRMCSKTRKTHGHSSFPLLIHHPLHSLSSLLSTWSFFSILIDILNRQLGHPAWGRWLGYTLPQLACERRQPVDAMRRLNAHRSVACISLTGTCHQRPPLMLVKFWSRI